MRKNKTSNNLTLENIQIAIRNIVREVVHDELVPIDFRLTNLESEVKLLRKTYEERFDRMATGIDKLLGVGMRHAEEHAANQSAHDRFQEDINVLKHNQKFPNVLN